MKSSFFISRQAKSVAFRFFLLFLLPLFHLPAVAQESVKPTAIDRRPKYGMLLVIGYEMDKARADAIMQKQDMTKNARETVGKLESLVKAKGATHCSCAAQIIRSGTRSSLDMGVSHLEVEGGIGASGDFAILTMQRSDRISRTSATVRASLKIGDYAFVGTVPDVKPGKDQLLFVRFLMHYLE